MQIGLGDLAGNHGLAAIAHRGGNHHRELDFVCCKNVADRHHRRLGVEGIKDGFDHQNIGTTGDQAPDLVPVSLHRLVKGDTAETEVLRVRKLREGDRHWPDGTGHVTFAAGFVADFIRPFPAESGGLKIDVPGEFVEVFILQHALEKLGVLAAFLLVRPAVPAGVEELALREAGAGKGVRFNDVGPGFEEPFVDITDDTGVGQGKQVPIVADILRGLFEAFAAGLLLIEPIAPDGGPHGAINDHDAFGQFGAKLGFGIRARLVESRGIGSDNHGHRCKIGKSARVSRAMHHNILIC